MKRNVFASILLASSTVSVVAAVQPAQAWSAISLCNTTITSGRHQLVADLNCGDNESGIIVNGSDITIDLAGFTISGDGGGTYFDERGIHILPTSRYVKISNGTIHSFTNDAVYVDNAQNVVVSNLRIFDIYDFGNESDGVDGNDALNLSIDNLYFDGDSDGSDNSVSHSGIECGGCASLTVSRSTILDADQGAAIDNSTRVKISNSTFVNSEFDGVELIDSDSTLNAVIARDNGGDGFDVNCDDEEDVVGQMLTLTTSLAIGNTGYGFELRDCGSPVLKPIVKGNRAEGNGGDGFISYRMTNTTYDGNTSANNAGNGFEFGPAYPGPSVKSNTALNNLGDGFRAYSNEGIAALSNGSSNISRSNGGWGFSAEYAVPGTGNTASGNSLGQCDGWVCKRR